MSRTRNSKTTSAGQNLSQKELVRIYGRLHRRLIKQVRQSKRESDRTKGKDISLRRKYSESAKELYAYVRLMELCQLLSKDVAEMHEILGAIANSSLKNGERPN